MTRALYGIGILFFLSSPLFGACKIPFKELSICGDLKWSQGSPVVKTESQGTLQFTDLETGKVLQLDNVRAKLWMPQHGHGSRPTEVTKLTDPSGNEIPGAFNLRKVFFIMPGLWQIILTVTSTSGQTDEAVFTLTVK